jgi:hypothetical protein
MDAISANVDIFIYDGLKKFRVPARKDSDRKESSIPIAVVNDHGLRMTTPGSPKISVSWTDAQGRSVKMEDMVIDRGSDSGQMIVLGEQSCKWLDAAPAPSAAPTKYKFGEDHSEWA